MAIRIFRHYIPKPLIILGLAEVLVLLFSAYAGIGLRFGDFNPVRKMLTTPLYPTASLFTLVMMTMMIGTGLYQRGLRDGFKGIALRLITSFVLGALVMAGLFVLLPGISLGREVMLYTLLVAFVGIALCRLLFYAVADHDLLKRRVLVLGGGREADPIKRLRRKADLQGISLVGYLCFRKDRAAVPEDKILPMDAPIPDLVRKNGIDEIVIAMDYRHEAFPIGEILECKMSGVQVTDLLSFMERQTGKISLDILRPTNIIFLEGFSHAVLKSYTKRVFDIVVSLLLLAVTAPILLLTALAIKLECGGKGPVFYLQQRVGRNGKNFNVIKFRSMRVDAEKDGVAQWAGKNDARVTRVGALIRKTRIDELPQLINVLRGDMSFVGPRPERPQFVTELAKQIPYFGIRHRVNPGITGWAQISYPYGASVEDSKEKLQYDLYYIKNYSIFLDITILFQTVQVILWGKGR